MKTKSKNSTKRKSEQAKLLKRYGQWCALLKVIAIVITLLYLMTLGGCSAVSEAPKIKEPCLQSVTTYGEVLECAIKLNEVQK